MKLSAINYFPIKSCQGVEIDHCEIQARGIQHDRRYLVIDKNNRAVTGRENTALALLNVVATDTGLAIRSDNGADLQIAVPAADAPTHSVSIWDDTVQARDLGDSVAEKLTTILAEPVRLVYMDDTIVRDIEAAYPHEQALPLSFADTYPMLVINESSVTDLSDLAGEALSAKRFRANFHISGAPEWDEDSWYKIRIANVRFDVANPCARCKFTTRDPDTAEIHANQEPLRTLARHRRGDDGEVYFGQHLVPLESGRIKVGDSVSIEQRGPLRPTLKNNA